MNLPAHFPLHSLYNLMKALFSRTRPVHGMLKRFRGVRSFSSRETGLPSHGQNLREPFHYEA